MNVQTLIEVTEDLRHCICQCT